MNRLDSTKKIFIWFNAVIFVFFPFLSISTGAYHDLINGRVWRFILGWMFTLIAANITMFVTVFFMRKTILENKEIFRIIDENTAKMSKEELVVLLINKGYPKERIENIILHPDNPKISSKGRNVAYILLSLMVFLVFLSIFILL